jgi:hypothetical protein
MPEVLEAHEDISPPSLVSNQLGASRKEKDFADLSTNLMEKINGVLFALIMSNADYRGL